MNFSILGASSLAIVTLPVSHSIIILKEWHLSLILNTKAHYKKEVSHHDAWAKSNMAANSNMGANSNTREANQHEINTYLFFFFALVLLINATQINMLLNELKSWLAVKHGEILRVETTKEKIKSARNMSSDLSRKSMTSQI